MLTNGPIQVVTLVPRHLFVIVGMQQHDSTTESIEHAVPLRLSLNLVLSMRLDKNTLPFFAWVFKKVKGNPVALNAPREAP